MNTLSLFTSFQDVVGAIAAIVSVALTFFACFVSPVVVLIVFCDARTVFRWISGRTNKYVAWFFFLGCGVWLIYWYSELRPLIAQIVFHEAGVN
jgi:hypothetical protein